MNINKLTMSEDNKRAIKTFVCSKCGELSCVNIHFVDEDGKSIPLTNYSNIAKMIEHDTDDICADCQTGKKRVVTL